MFVAEQHLPLHLLNTLHYPKSILVLFIHAERLTGQHIVGFKLASRGDDQYRGAVMQYVHFGVI